MGAGRGGRLVALVAAALLAASAAAAGARRRNVPHDLPTWMGETHRNLRVEEAQSDATGGGERPAPFLAKWGRAKHRVDAATGAVSYDESAPAAPRRAAPLMPPMRVGPVGVRAQGLRYAHMAALAVAHNRSVALAWQGSPTAEGSDGQRIYVAFSVDGAARHWWPARVAVDTGPKGGAQWGPALWTDADKGETWLFYTESTPDCVVQGDAGRPNHWIVGGDVKVVRIGTAGSWSAPVMLYARSAGGIPKVLANGPIETSSGQLVLPFWRQKPRAFVRFDAETNKTALVCDTAKPTSAGVLISSDRGGTWQAYGSLGTSVCLKPPEKCRRHSKECHPVLSPQEAECAAAGWLIENAVTERSDGSLMMLFRTRAGFAYQSVSTNQGLAWSMAEARPDLPNPDSKLTVTRLSSGTHVIAFNEHQRPVRGTGSAAQRTRERNRLTLAMSSDDGASWVRVGRIDPPNPAEAARTFNQEQFHYPSVVELAGTLVVAFTHSTLADPTVSAFESAAGGDETLTSGNFEIWTAEYNISMLERLAKTEARRGLVFVGEHAPLLRGARAVSADA